MKKRHKQKLVILSLALFILLNAPLLLMFNSPAMVAGLPLIYVYIFTVWFLSALVSMLIIRKFDE